MFEAGEDCESVVELTFKMVPIKASKKKYLLFQDWYLKKVPMLFFRIKL